MKRTPSLAGRAALVALSALVIAPAGHASELTVGDLNVMDKSVHQKLLQVGLSTNESAAGGEDVIVTGTGGTQVYAGSYTRVATPYPAPVDSTWIVTWQCDTHGDAVIIRNTGDGNWYLVDLSTHECVTYPSPQFGPGTGDPVTTQWARPGSSPFLATQSVYGAASGAPLTMRVTATNQLIALHGATTINGPFTLVDAPATNNYQPVGTNVVLQALSNQVLVNTPMLIKELVPQGDLSMGSFTNKP